MCQRPSFGAKADAKVSKKIIPSKYIGGNFSFNGNFFNFLDINQTVCLKKNRNKEYLTVIYAHEDYISQSFPNRFLMSFKHIFYTGDIHSRIFTAAGVKVLRNIKLFIGTISK